MASEQFIVIKGAREHNLQNIEVSIPKNKLVVITGVSGSGKSSLAFDTLYAEAQRRYVESLSTYARQFLEQLSKPDVDTIEGLSPAIAIEQKTTQANPRSTVGTITEIYDYLRVFYARLGHVWCDTHKKYIVNLTAQKIVDSILNFQESTKVQVLAPVITGQKGTHKKALLQLRKDGFVRVRVDGEIYELEEEISLEQAKPHTIEVIYDRLVVRPNISQRVTDSVEAALRIGKGTIRLLLEYPDKTTEDLLQSTNYMCPDCGKVYPELEPAMFSFNSPHGACTECHGLGKVMGVELDLVVPDPALSIKGGAVAPWNLNRRTDAKYRRALKRLCEDYEQSVDTSWKDLDEQFRACVLYGESKDGIKRKTLLRKRKKAFEGVIPNIKRRFHQTESSRVREMLSRFMTEGTCPVCRGTRLRPEVQNVHVGQKSILEICEYSVSELTTFFAELVVEPHEQKIAAPLLREICSRLRFLLDTGLGYLSLSRTAHTLSGGESQRIRLASQLGSGLSGVLYVLDEPSIGLHPADTANLIGNLRRLRDMGNTVVVVEHDREIIEAADYIIDVGPGAGREGGFVCACGSRDELSSSNSITGRYLNGEFASSFVSKKRKLKGKALKLIGANHNNLKQIDVEFPLGCLIAVSGVSGSGKSSLINDTLYPALCRELKLSHQEIGKHSSLLGAENIDKVIWIDQSAIGKTPRSNPASYTGMLKFVRDVYAQTQEARVRGFGPGRFSFNLKGGRCETCQGDGSLRVEMHFLPDVFVTCPDCKGLRYNRETLEVKFKGLTIADVLSLTVQDAREFFRAFPKLVSRLDTLTRLGLGYIQLGQAANTLSGGEAQRLKLSAELAKKQTGRTLYLLDEPTTGLHASDVIKLVETLQVLVEHGNTVVVIEHNPDVLRATDWLIDLGPEGGEKGGYLIFQGPTKDAVKCLKSSTARFL